MPLRRPLLALLVSVGLSCHAPGEGASTKSAGRSAGSRALPTKPAPASSSAPVTPEAPDTSREAPDASREAARDAATPPPPPPLPFASWASLCDLDRIDATAAPLSTKPSPRAVAVSFSSRDVRPGPASSSAGAVGFSAFVDAPAAGLRAEVFHLPFGGDPYQCCAETTADALTFTCTLGGVDQIEARGIAKREGDELVVRFCTANLSVKRVMASGAARARLTPETTVSFRPRKPACAPPLPP